MRKLSAPPGFVSQTSFVLKKIEGDGKNCTSATGLSTEAEPTPVDILSHVINNLSHRRLLERAPWMLYDEYKEDEKKSVSEQHLLLSQSFSSHTPLPRGVIRGCQDCGDCQKVTARWHPEDACSTALQDAPVFHPTEEEFADMPVYIASIWKNVESYGICRIVPPSSWKPPCFDLGKNSKFTTQIQSINKLRLDHKHKGSFRGKRTRHMRSGEGECELGVLGSETAQEMDLETFKKSADGFKFEYFQEKDEIKSSDVTSATSFKKWEPSVENIEGEYWRIAEDPTEEIEIICGADLDPRDFVSDTPPKSTNDHKSLRSSWNLKIINQFPDSLLSYETCEDLSVLNPRLHIGMCFSSLCWKVGEHHLYSLWYMHTGSPRIWYGVPGSCSFKFQAAVKKYYPAMVAEQPELLYKLIRQLSPSALKSEGIPVYRCVQSLEEFVLVLPGAYHSGVDCGFNCVEGTKFAPLDWLPHGQFAVEVYSEQRLKTLFSHDKLLLQAANEAVKAQWEILLMKKTNLNNLIWKSNCQKDGILAKALKARIKWLESKMKYLCNPEEIQPMEKNFDAYIRRECSICFYDLHLSAAGCSCSPGVYTCLIHAKKLCICPWVSRFFLFRYEIGKLKVLVDALEGKLSAVMIWAKEVLRFSLSSNIRNGITSTAASVSYKSSLDGKHSESQSLAAASGIKNASEKDAKLKASTPEVTISENFEKNKPTGYLGSLGGTSLSCSPLGDSLSDSSSTSSSDINLSEMFPISTAKASCSGFETEVTSAENPGNKRKRMDSSQLSSKQPMQKCTTAGKETIILLSDDEGYYPGAITCFT